MVFALVAITVLLIIAAEIIWRREERTISASTRHKKSTIFISPEKAIRPVGKKSDRWYHSSHTWVVSTSGDSVYVGIDNFMPELFSKDVYFSHLPDPGTKIHQGDRTWNIGLADKKVSQYAPISGEVEEINPAVSSGMALPTENMEKSWVLKIKPSDLESERHNLVSHDQAMRINRMLGDELKWTAQQGHYLNDGGVLDPDFVARMNDVTWRELTNKFFQFNEPKNKEG